MAEKSTLFLSRSPAEVQTRMALGALANQFHFFATEVQMQLPALHHGAHSLAESISNIIAHIESNKSDELKNRRGPQARRLLHEERIARLKANVSTAFKPPEYPAQDLIEMLSAPCVDEVSREQYESFIKMLLPYFSFIDDNLFHYWGDIVVEEIPEITDRSFYIKPDKLRLEPGLSLYRHQSGYRLEVRFKHPTNDARCVTWINVNHDGVRFEGSVVYDALEDDYFEVRYGGEAKKYFFAYDISILDEWLKASPLGRFTQSVNLPALEPDKAQSMIFGALDSDAPAGKLPRLQMDACVVVRRQGTSDFLYPKELKEWPYLEWKNDSCHYWSIKLDTGRTSGHYRLQFDSCPDLDYQSLSVTSLPKYGNESAAHVTPQAWAYIVSQVIEKLPDMREAYYANLREVAEFRESKETNRTL